MPDVSEIRIRFGLLLTALIAVASASITVAVTLTNIARDVDDLKAAQSKSWNALHMELWCLSTERQNGKWRCADPKEIARPHSTGPL